MLRIIAILVVGLFAILWASGNDVNSVKDKMTHWANGGEVAGGGTSDWGES